MTTEAIKKAIKQLESIGYKEVVEEYESQEEITHAIPWVMANRYSGDIFVQQLTCSSEQAEHEALFPLFTPDAMWEMFGLNEGEEHFKEQIQGAIKRLKKYLNNL